MDHAPDELYWQTPFKAALIRQLPGPDRPDYWLAALRKPLRWVRHGAVTMVRHVVLAARWQGTEIGRGMWGLPVKIIYVVDDSLVDDAVLDYGKCEYVAIGTANDALAISHNAMQWLRVLAGWLFAKFRRRR